MAACDSGNNICEQLRKSTTEKKWKRKKMRKLKSHKVKLYQQQNIDEN